MNKKLIPKKHFEEVLKEANKKIQGKKDRAAGKRFEDKVRADLEKKGWIVDRWTNNVEFKIEKVDCDSTGKIMPKEEIIKKSRFIEPVICSKERSIGKLIPAKPKIRMSKLGPILMNAHTGFPDFVAFTIRNSNAAWPIENPDKSFYLSGINANIGVECKQTGKLDKEEKEKCKWLLDNNIFSKILIASKGEKRGEIIYKEFKY